DGAALHAERSRCSHRDRGNQQAGAMGGERATARGWHAAGFGLRRDSRALARARRARLDRPNLERGGGPDRPPPPPPPPPPPHPPNPRPRPGGAAARLDPRLGGRTLGPVRPWPALVGDDRGRSASAPRDGGARLT